jgi:hypothetical protein
MKGILFSVFALVATLVFTDTSFGQCRTTRATFSTGITYGSGTTFNAGTGGGCVCPTDAAPVFSAPAPVYFNAAPPVVFMAATHDVRGFSGGYTAATFSTQRGGGFRNGNGGGGGGRNFQFGLFNSSNRGGGGGSNFQIGLINRS